MRYGLAAAIFLAIVLFAERRLSISRRDLGLVGLAAFLIFLNQLAFVYALDTTNASTIALVLGATPAFAALIGLTLGLERMSRRFWAASFVSFAGVGLVALGTGSGVEGGLTGVLLGMTTAATWAGYSVAIAPLMQRYSPSRVSAVVISLAWAGIAVVGAPQTAEQDFALGWQVWSLLLLATLGPLVVTTILWFRALGEIGASRATLIANLQPFVAALFALLLLSERMTLTQVAGGALIAGGILLARATRAADSPGRRRVTSGRWPQATHMPLEGWDHLELWVGNAKQAAYWYEHALGFTRTAYAGPETGVRDRASYVLEQGEIRLVLTSGLRGDGEIVRFAASHGDGAKDIALRVPDARQAYREAVQRGARGISEPTWVEDEHGRVELATIATYGDVVHTFVNRADYRGPYLPGYVSLAPNGASSDGVGLVAIDHVVGNVELGRMNHWVDFYERVFGMRNIVHFGDDQIQTEYSALMSKVMADGSGKIKFPINEPAEGKRKSQIEEYLEFNGVTGRAAHRPADDGHRAHDRDPEGPRRALPRHARGVLRRRRGPRRRDRGGLLRPAAAAHPGRPRRRRLPPADLHQDGAGPADALLRGDRASRRHDLRRGQLQGPLRVDRARAGPARESLMGVGAILAVIGIVLAVTGRWVIGVILIIIGLLFGGFRRGSWY